MMSHFTNQKLKPLFVKKIIYFVASACILLISCQKEDNPTSTTADFSAKIDGHPYTFTLTNASLLRNPKQLDITLTSTDGQKRITFILAEATEFGNAVTVKKYVLNPYPVDNPSTTNVDESNISKSFSTYGTATGNSWKYDLHYEDGFFTVSTCDVSSTTISATFQTSLTDQNDNTHVIKITEGKLNNIKYTVVN